MNSVRPVAVLPITDTYETLVTETLTIRTPAVATITYAQSVTPDGLCTRSRAHCRRSHHGQERASFNSLLLANEYVAVDSQATKGVQSDSGDTAIRWAPLKCTGSKQNEPTV